MPSKSIAHVIPTSYDTTFQRYYAVEAPDLRRLYENAKRDQWNASSDIDWAIEVEQLLRTRYASAEKVILICDNLNTHTKGLSTKHSIRRRRGRLCAGWNFATPPGMEAG